MARTSGGRAGAQAMGRTRMTSRLIAAVLAVLLFVVVGRPEAAERADVTAFHEAVQRGDVPTVRAMLEKDASLATAVGKYGFRPIHLIDMYFEAEILDLLLARGADVNARNDEGVTILHIITDADAVPILIAKGADREARDKRGWTPLLTMAQERDREDVIEALLRAGADPNARGPKGETALAFARRRGEKGVARLLRKAGAHD